MQNNSKISNSSSRGGDFCYYMFTGCSGLTGVPATPTSNTNIQINKS